MSTLGTQLPWQTIVKASRIDKAKGYFNIWPIIGTFCTPQASQGSNLLFLQYNYTATRNFSISKLTVDPTFKKYIDYDLVIRHNNFDGTVNRYKLWPFDVPGTEYLNIPKYAGQVIKKNFSIELWALNPYGMDNILENLFASVMINTGATKYGEIYYTDGGSADISQANEIAEYRLTVEGNYYFYYDPNDDGATIYLDNGGNVVPNGSVFQATDVVGLVAPLETICTATIRRVPDYTINDAAAAAGVAQQTIAQTKAYISLLKDKLTINDADEYEETSVNSVPCNVLQAGVFTPALFVFPIPFLDCSAGLPNSN